MGAWDQFAQLLFEDAIEHIKADIMGISHIPLIVCPPTISYIYMCIEDFSYIHAEQDVNNGTYRLKQNELYILRSGPNDEHHFLSDRSKLVYIGEIEENGINWEYKN